MKVKPSNYCLVGFEQREFVDLRRLEQAVLRRDTREQIHAISVLVGEVVPLSAAELAVFRGLRRGTWSSAAEIRRLSPGLAATELLGLARKGVLVCDSADPELSELRLRHEVLEAKGWDSLAALFHVMARWRDRSGEEGAYPETAAELDEALSGAKSILRQFVDEYGLPPAEFHSRPDGTGRFELGIPSHESPLVELLSSRKTTRNYDSRQPMSVTELSTVLYYVYGCHGVFEPIPGLRLLKKTSPSPGSLHSIEVYPLVLNVDGVAPGVYHYRVADHSLDLLRALTRKRARAMADVTVPGQGFPNRAGALFLMTARFERQFWKYRKMPVAYTALMLEAGHLSQTFYLVCADLGLGAFVTQAINGYNIDQELGLDGLKEGAIALSGCGRMNSRSSVLDPGFEPYLPRRSTSKR